MARDWRDGFAEFFGQGADDSVAGGRRFKPGGQGVVDRNIWDDVWGRSQTELNTSAKTAKDDKLEAKYKPTINSLKPGSFERGGDAGSYEAQVRSLTRTDDNSAFDDSPSGKAMAHQMGLQTQTLAQQGTQMANQMELTRLQMEQQNKDRGFDRETQSAQNNLTLQLGQMNADLQDKRLAYDRETRSMDKRDRMIATLMSGLGSLGGAFSL